MLSVHAEALHPQAYPNECLDECHQVHFGTSNVRKVLALRSVQAIRQAIAASRPAVLRPPAEGAGRAPRLHRQRGAGRVPRLHRQRGAGSLQTTGRRGPAVLQGTTGRGEHAGNFVDTPCGGVKVPSISHLELNMIICVLDVICLGPGPSCIAYAYAYA